MPDRYTTTIYNWNIIESDVKHHSPNPDYYKYKSLKPKMQTYNVICS